MHDNNLLEDQPIAWTPTPDVIERAQLTKFMRQVGVSTWDELYEFSIRDVEKFTEEVLKFLDIKFDPPYEKLLDTSGGIEFPNWFASEPPASAGGEESAAESRAGSASSSSDATSPPAHAGGSDSSAALKYAGLNITEMCLDQWQAKEMAIRERQMELEEAGENDASDALGSSIVTALIWEDEVGRKVSLTYLELSNKVDHCASGLLEHGLRAGDAVGIHLPMSAETVVALLAINRIGGIAVPVFSGYGIEAIVSRMKAVDAKAIFTCKGFNRRGKFFNARQISTEVVDQCPTIEKVFVVEEFGKNFKTEFIECATAHIADSLEREEMFGKPDPLARKYVSSESLMRSSIYAYPQTARTSAEDPLIILYTSGTTGKPKGIAHTHASFPIKAAQDMAFGTDVGRGTRICWYTDIGWMMGPWLIYGALINGATICIYDGAPDYPTPDRMWEFCAKHKVEVLGISPTLVRALAAHEERSADTLVRMDAASASIKMPTPSPTDRKGWYRHKLPHFDGNVTQFITFRLADSLPKGQLDKLRQQLEIDGLTDNFDEFRQRVEDQLDQGAGSCILRDPQIAQFVEETILKEDGVSCDVNAWVVMPNHAHVLLRPYKNHSLASIMKRIKGISARKINLHTGGEGRVWQADYFDRYVRDEADFLRTLEYIENNPVKAGFVKEASEWQFSSASRRAADDHIRTSAALMRTGANDPEFSGNPDILAGGTGDADKSVRAPFERHDLSSLRIFTSTGEPWNPAPWWWLFEKVGNSRLPIINYSGGTEIAGGILMGNPLLPIKPCSFPAPCPGMDVDILDEDGKPVGPGKVGELVIKQPWIGMARGFWQEKDRYLETYWRRFKDIWVHGDWAMRDADGHWFILGRSDDTLKVAGKRVGPAEVESLLVAHPLVTEAAVIGVPDEAKGTAMVAFCVLVGPQASRLRERETRTGAGISAMPNSKDISPPSGDASGTLAVPGELAAKLKALVTKDMGKPLAPSKIHFVSALPKTRNAKVMRRVIRAAYLGEDPGDLSALENPRAVEEIGSARNG